MRLETFILLVFFLFPMVIVAQEKVDRKVNFPKQELYPEKIPSPKNVWVFIMAGQSNMAGRGFVEPEDTIPDPRVLSINSKGDIIIAKEPFHFYEPTMTGLDCGLYFARTLLKEIPDSISILMIPTAVGGSAIDQWLGDSTHRNVKLLTNFTQKMLLARKYGQVKAILWHQGESDSNPKLIAGYGKKQKKLFKIFRKLSGNKRLPVFTAGIGLFANDNANKILINEIIVKNAVTDRNIHVVPTSDFQHKGDKLHFDSASQRKMGERMAKEFLKTGKF